ncbi:phosphatidylinositol transfer protein csr1 [Coemansia sp. RSA 2705]|nr:phosphatidylinositol transfer protein csr1 [Coemansia sp. RSA 2705]
MTVPDTADIGQIYSQGERQLGGTVGHLDARQEAALKAAWAKLLAHFDSTADTPIPVDKSLVRLSGLAKDAVATDDAAAVAQWYADHAVQVAEVKHQLVRDKLYLDGHHAPLVPGAFSPLLGDPQDSRRFSSAFWQACMRYASPDTYVIGSLRATEWDADKAFAHVVHSVQRRISQEIDRLMWEGDLLMNRRISENGLCIRTGCDKFGYPVFVVPVRLNIARERTDADVEKFAAYSLEKVAQLARKHEGRAVLLYDFSGFKLENVDLSFSKILITTVQELYPYTFSATLLFVNSWLFSGIWKVMRGWMDPVVARRTMIVKDAKALETFIPRDQIPTSMGGQLKFQYQYVYPTTDENAKMFDAEGRQRAEHEFAASVEAFSKQTKGWVGGSQSYNNESRTQAAAAFDSAAVELDPYIRARFVEERT